MTNFKHLKQIRVEEASKLHHVCEFKTPVIREKYNVYRS